MRSFIGSRNLTVVLGVSLCGVTGYLLYLFLKKDEDDDYNSTLPKKAAHKVSEVKVPKEWVRELIGKNGRTIKNIEMQSSTKINFKDQVANEDTRTCIIRGTKDDCKQAENLIFEYLSKRPKVESIDIFVPQSCVGKIIGRCGENITELVNLTGAKIKVIEGDRSTETTRRINIKGEEKQIKLAQSYIEEIVERHQQRKLEMDSLLARREPRVPPKSVSPNLRLVESPKTEKITSVPGQPDSQFEVYVSAMVDPSHFWLQIVGPKATELDLLVEEMTEYYSKEENQETHALTNIQKGDLVAATFQYDNKWYRAEILKIETNDNGEDVAELYYVDYGDTDYVSVKNMYELRTDFLRLHFQAIECYLARVEPHDKENWTEEAIDKFEEWTYVAQWKKLSAHLNGCCSRERTRAKREGSPVPGVDLYDVNNGQDIDIAEELVKHGFAVFKKEEKLSSRATSQNSVDSL